MSVSLTQQTLITMRSTSEGKMWFHANGWKVFNVCVTWFPFCKILFDETWNKFCSSLFAHTKACTCLVHSHACRTCFFYRAFAFISGVRVCVSGTCQLNASPIVQRKREKEQNSIWIVKKSTNVKELKLNCVHSFAMCFLVNDFSSSPFHISLFEFLGVSFRLVVDVIYLFFAFRFHWLQSLLLLLLL